MARPKIAIFTPTQRPGIDVSLASVARQEVDADLMWIVADELHASRRHVLFNLYTDYRDKFKLYHFFTPKKSGSVRNLAKVYNIAFDVAQEWGADMVVSMQDYIWAPPDGVAKFAQYIHDRSLITGITHISEDPVKDQIWDLLGMYTIFFEGYTQKPEKIGWHDPRVREDFPPGIRSTNAIEFETNWAAFPRQALYDKDLYFDEAYDQGVAYENQDYAYRAKSNLYEIGIDQDNVAISLPHRDYWPGEWDYEQPYTQENRMLSEARWGTP